MTVVQMKSKYGHKHLLADGHANYSEAGTDIVCASVSILLQSFIYHSQLAEGKKNVKITKLESGPGFIHLIVHDPNGVLDDAFGLIKDGLTMLDEDYPEYVMLVGEK